MSWKGSYPVAYRKGSEPWRSERRHSTRKAPKEAFVAPIIVAPALVPAAPLVEAAPVVGVVPQIARLVPVVGYVALLTVVGKRLLTFPGPIGGWGHPSFDWCACPTGPSPTRYAISHASHRYPGIGNPPCSNPEVAPYNGRCGGPGYAFTIPGASVTPETYEWNTEIGAWGLQSGFWKPSGTYIWNGRTVEGDDVWAEPRPGEAPGIDVPGFGTVLQPAHNDYPWDLPIHWPTVVPTPTSWPDAVAQPGTQPSSRPAEPVTAPVEVPLLPYPAYTVTLPDGATGVVPDQVITVPTRPVRPKPDAQPKPGEDGPPPPTGYPPSGGWGGGQLGRPDKNTKERKLNVRTAAGKGWLVVNAATEVLDLTNALWDALPKKCKKRRKARGFYSQEDKFRDLWDCWDHLDLAKAFENIVNEQIEDMFYGQVGRQVGNATGRFGISTGLNRAIREAQRAWAEQTEDGLAIPLPQVDIADNGQFHVTVGGTVASFVSVAFR